MYEATKTTEVTNSFDDPNHHLHLHHSDHPGVVLISQPFIEDNYQTWSRAVTMALSAKNKLEFIDSKIPSPADSAKEFPQWSRCNNTVKSWLLNSISKEISLSVIYCKNACDIWEDLKARFSLVNGPCMFQLEQDISNLVQGTMSVATYFTKLKSLWDELSALQPNPSCSFFKKIHLSLIHESRTKLLQYSACPEVSVAKLQRYQHQIRRITIQTLKIYPLTYD
jgi:hypothetical protein